MKITINKTQKKATTKGQKENYIQVRLSMPNEKAEALDSYCKEKGHTKAGFIRQDIKDKIAENE